MSELARKRGRLMIYAMAGVFILMEAYNLMKALETATEDRIFLIIFMIFFAIIGAVMVIWGTVGSYKLMKPAAKNSADSLPEESKEKIEDSEENE